MILNDKQIRFFIDNVGDMITPFNEKLVDAGKLSYGLGSFGYDVTLDECVYILRCMDEENEIDPKRMSKGDTELLPVFIEGDDKYVLIPPKSYFLGNTKETFNIPRDVSVLAVGKSTYARAGLVINTTPIEAGFSGTVVIEGYNCTDSFMRVYVNEGISQFLFFEGEECGVSYNDRDGKYQNQTGVVLGKVK